MSKQNCWEHLNCGREPGGSKIKELGICPASTDASADGFLGGKNAGRACVYIVGTFCGGKTQGNHEQKRAHCERCEFYQHLRREHGAEMTVLQFGKYCREKSTPQATSVAGVG